MSAEFDKEMQIVESSEPTFEVLDVASLPPRTHIDGAVGQRHRFASITQRVIPIEISVTPNALDVAQQMRAENIPFIVPYSHSRMRDSIDAPSAIIQLGELFDDTEYSGAAASHQLEKPYIRLFADRAQMKAYPVVTESTVRKGKNFEHVSLRNKAEMNARHLAGHLPLVPAYEKPLPNELRRGHGLNEYLTGSVDTLKNGGIVFIAPQGERRTELGEPIRAVEMLVWRAKKNGVDMNNVAILPMGIMIMDEDNPEEHDHNFKMLHSVRKTATVKIEAPMRISELESAAIEAGTSLDDIVFAKLRRVLPHSYYSEDQRE